MARPQHSRRRFSPPPQRPKRETKNRLLSSCEENSRGETRYPTVPPGSGREAVHSIAADNGAGPAVIWHRAGKGGTLFPVLCGRLQPVPSALWQSIGGSADTFLVTLWDLCGYCSPFGRQCQEVSSAFSAAASSAASSVSAASSATASSVSTASTASAWAAVGAMPCAARRSARRRFIDS